jgi:hypothetical protein
MFSALKVLMRAHNRSCSSEVIDLLVAAIEGLPARINPICKRAMNVSEMTLPAVRTELGCDWAAGLRGYLTCLLSDVEPEAATIALPSNVAVGEQVRRVRLVLDQIYLHGVDAQGAPKLMLDPALTHLRHDYWSELVGTMKQRAASRGVEWRRLWQEMASHWLIPDWSDPAGFVAAGRSTWLIANGTRPPGPNIGLVYD